jgi:protein-tyrosine-phosphatase
MSEGTATKGQPPLLMPQAVLSRTAADLADRFAGVFTPQTVERYVFESYTALHRTARVHAHLTSLTQRFATDRLTALAQSTGDAPKDVPEVLFLCEQNAGRSQMAAALLDHHAQGRVHVRSAGSTPAAAVHTVAATVMAEIGLDLSRAFPKPLTDDVVAAADCVVTMGCGDACPIYPGTRYLDWPVTDPDGQDLDAARAVRDDIDARVQALLAELTTHATT